MLKLLTIILLTFLSTGAAAQVDTIPELLQKTNFPGAISQIVYRHSDSILLFSSNRIFLSMDRGISFTVTDSENGANTIYLTKAGPLFRIDKASMSAVERSTDAGASWQPTQSPEYARAIDNISTDGTRYSFNDILQNRDFITSNFGASWDTITYNSGSNLRPTSQAWYDALHGLEFHQSKNLVITSDGGQTWDTLFQVGDTSQYTNGIVNLSQGLQYPAPGVLAITGFANSGLYLSLDTGRTWSFAHSVESNITVLATDNWLGFAQSGSVPPNTLVRSSDRGKSWQTINYTCPNVGGAMTFSDSLHGAMLGNTVTSGSNITLGTTTNDGGRTWQCVDTTAYLIGAGDYTNSQYIFPDPTAPNTYYALANAYNRIYLTRSTDRGTSWAILFPVPWSPVEGYSQPLLLGNKFFFPYSGSIRWTLDLGVTYHEQDFPAAYQTVGGFVERAADGTLWAGNPGILLLSNDSGTTWNNLTEQLPNYNPDSNFTYQFQVVDRMTGFAKLGTAIYRTTDAGATWRSDSLLPDYVIDARDWIVLSKHERTTDAGATWTSFTRPPATSGTFFPAGPERWYYFGSCTTNAGVSWQAIPGWRSGLTVVDSATAFSTNAPPLVRLDLPFKGASDRVEERAPITISARVSPNPAGNDVALFFSLVQPGQATVTLMNVMGTTISATRSGSLGAGPHSTELSLAGLPPGIYYVRVESGEASQTLKVVKE